MTAKRISPLPVHLALAAILFLLAAACTKTTNAGSANAIAADALPTVAVVKATRNDLSSDLVMTGEFEPFQEVDVMSKVAGYLKQINVDIGDHVREGQLLATLEIPEMDDDLAKAGASIQQVDAEVAAARDELHRSESVHEMAHLSSTRIQDVAKKEVGLVPQQEVDEIRSRDLVAEAQVAAAKSKLRAAEQLTRVSRADETRFKTLRKYTLITAPFAGVVTKRYANTGSMIQAGTASQSQAMPVIRLSQNGLLRLVLPVPESAVPRIHVGGPVAVHVSSLDRTFPGKIARFSSKIQQSTRTMITEVDVPNSSLILVPEMFADVNLRVEQRDQVLCIPPDAIEGTGSSARVYTVRDGGVIHVVPVTLGLETAHRVEVRSGLQEGDVVITGRRTGLKDGGRVQPKLVNIPAE